MISLLFARVIDSLYPERNRGIRGSYIINARPMLHAEMNHHNFVTTVFMDYSDKTGYGHAEPGDHSEISAVCDGRRLPLFTGSEKDHKVSKDQGTLPG